MVPSQLNKIHNKIRCPISCYVLLAHSPPSKRNHSQLRSSHPLDDSRPISTTSPVHRSDPRDGALQRFRLGRHPSLPALQGRPNGRFVDSDASDASERHQEVVVEAIRRNVNLADIMDTVLCFLCLLHNLDADRPPIGEQACNQIHIVHDIPVLEAQTKQGNAKIHSPVITGSPLRM